MKTFINKKTQFTSKDEKIGFAKLAEICLDNPPKEGWSPQDMKLSIKIESKLEDQKFDAKIKLEDTEFDYLYIRCQPENMKWAVKHQSIVDFSEYLEILKKE